MEYLAFSPQDKWLVAGGGKWLKSGRIQAWRCSDWKLTSTWEAGISGQIQNGCFLSEHKFLSIGGVADSKDARKYGGSELRVWDLQEGKELERIILTNSRGFASHIDFLPEKSLLATNQWSPFGTAGVCSVPDLQTKTTFASNLEFNARLRWSPIGETLLCCNRRNLLLYDAATGKLLKTRRLDDADDELDGSEIRFAGFSPKGDMIAVASLTPKAVYVIPSDLGESLLRLEVSNADFAAFSPDNETVAVARDESIDLVSIREKKTIHSIPNAKARAQRWCFSQDGARIALAGSWDIQIYDVATGTRLRELGK